MNLIEWALILSALYTGGMWLVLAVRAFAGRIVVDSELEQHTFHLGLCFILSVGLLGLLWK